MIFMMIQDVENVLKIYDDDDDGNDDSKDDGDDDH